jgi:putative transposase
MPQYRRAKTPGGTYFFTIVTYNRARFLCLPENIDLLRQSFRYVMTHHPFKTDAIVILPDHLHCIWTLPVDDADFSTRWRLIKSYFSHRCQAVDSAQVSISRARKQEKTVWQRRFWEHQIRDEIDYQRHVDYIHYNPVKHGLVKKPIDWEYTSFRRFVQAGFYAAEWGSDEEIALPSEVGQE